MGGALALDAAWLFAAFLIILVLVAVGIAARRYLLERRGATVECGLRAGRGSWRLGLASYEVDEFCWYGVFRISMRPEQVFPRRDLVVVSRRLPTGAEESIFGPDRVVVECQLATASQPGTPAGPGTPGTPPGPGTPPIIELALPESAITGLLAWLEAAPPGSHLDLLL